MSDRSTDPSPGAVPAGLEVLRVDHVGIAVPDLEAALRLWCGRLGFVEVHREENPGQDVVEAMLVAAGDDAETATRLQVLAPLSQESPIARFLLRRGPGLQHLAVEVPDVVAAAATLAADGLRLLYPDPRSGTADSLINFIHPKDTRGVLVELVQKGRSTA